MEMSPWEVSVHFEIGKGPLIYKCVLGSWSEYFR